MKYMWGVLKDYPAVATLAVAALVGVHWLLTKVPGPLPNVPGRVAAAPEAWSLYLGFAGVGAIVAGFTGVVTVFALTSDSPRFSKLRCAGGQRLIANWVWSIATAFVAAFGSVLATICALAGGSKLAWWLFEFVFLLAAMAAWRLIWLFGQLIEVVAADDQAAQASGEQRRSLDEVLSEGD